MSALAKPLIHTVDADNEVLGVSPVVNVEQLISMSPVDIPAMGSSKAKYRIVFVQLETDNQPKEIHWDFTVKATRDAKFAAALALASAAV